MSRHSEKLTEHITVYFGTCDPLGGFVQMTDNRYAGTKEDLQGEGYVLDFDQGFGMSVNLAGITEEELKNGDHDTIIKRIDLFISLMNKRLCLTDSK